VDLHYSIWLSIIPTIVALAAMAFAYRTARAAERAASAAERRPSTPRPPLLAVTVLDGRARRDLASDARQYAFLIAVENAAGAETTVTDVELRVSYRTRANFCGAVDIPVDIDAQVREGGPVRPHLQVPFRLGPGQAASGWVEFHTANVIPRHCRIDAYRIAITEASGTQATTDASLPSVLSADTDGRGPATWGWD
jgi:hypothetical protein